MTVPEALPRDDNRDYWERNAHRYDRSMRLLGGPLPRATELTAQAVTGGEVLEVATGTGLVTSALVKRATSVLATDYSVKMVERVDQRLDNAALAA